MEKWSDREIRTAIEASFKKLGYSTASGWESGSETSVDPVSMVQFPGTDKRFRCWLAFLLAFRDLLAIR